MASQRPRISVYTDGGCKPNPGPGGWGAVVLEGRRVVADLCGGEPATTNNRMELLAAIEALESLADGTEVAIHTDSRYLENGITRWIDGWRRNGWLTTERQPVSNRDLWERLDAAAARHRVRWAWVRGHAGNRHNERADALATKGRSQQVRAHLRQVEATPDVVHLHAAVSYSAKADEGGYGVVLRFGDQRKVLSGRATRTSANRLHLVAVVEGLRALKRPVAVHVYTGSSYVRDGAERWVAAWRARGWQTRDGKPVDHRDLWEELATLCARHRVTWPLVEKVVPPDLEAAKSAARVTPDSESNASLRAAGVTEAEH